MLKKIASYLFPFVTRRTSVHNGTLRVIFSEGKKRLNTDNANYSYGSLHRIMRFALGKVEIKPDDGILLLGLGGGSVVEIIRRDLGLKNPLVAVDFDPVIIEVAREEFGLDSYENVEIVCTDAFEYVQKEKRTYGLIVIDLFIDNEVPERFFGAVFWKRVCRILSPKGQIIFNAMIETTPKERFDDLVRRLESDGFSVSVHDRVDKTNIMILARRE